MGGDGCAGVERGVDLREEAEGFGTVAETRSLPEAALIPLHQRAVEQAGDGLMVGGDKRAKSEGSGHGIDVGRWGWWRGSGPGEFAGVFLDADDGGGNFFHVGA